MTRWSEEDYQAFVSGKTPTEKKPSKYHNEKPTAIDPRTGETIKFDSNKEMKFFFELLAREKAGEVFKIERQVEFEIQPAFTDATGKKQRPIKYVADFVFKERINPKRAGNIVTSDDIKVHVVDVKGSPKTLTEVYKLKKKLLAYKGIYIEEVY